MLKKAIILTTCICILFHLTVSGQDSFRPSTHIGLHGGINLSTVSFNPSVKQEFLLSEEYGIVLRQVSEPHIGMQIEVNLSNKGWKEVIDSFGNYTRRLKTINIPLTAVFIAGSRTIRVAFNIGPYASYLIKEKEKIELNDDNKYRSYYLKPLDNNWEFGFTGDLGFEVHTTIGALALRATYSHALTNLFPLNIDEYYYSGSRSQVIHIGLLYMITF